MIIESLIRINRWLPDYNYYLDVSDFLIKNNLKKEAPKQQRKIEEIEKYLQIALNCFEKEKDQLNEIQIKWFVLKKNLIKNRLELVKLLNLKYCEKN